MEQNQPPPTGGQPLSAVPTGAAASLPPCSPAAATVELHPQHASRPALHFGSGPVAAEHSGTCSQCPRLLLVLSGGRRWGRTPFPGRQGGPSRRRGPKPLGDEMAVDKDLLELDLYGLLGVGEKASEKEVRAVLPYFTLLFSRLKPVGTDLGLGRVTSVELNCKSVPSHFPSLSPRSSAVSSRNPVTRGRFRYLAS